MSAELLVAVIEDEEAIGKALQRLLRLTVYDV